MFRLIARISAIALLLGVSACDNNPHPSNLQEVALRKKESERDAHEKLRIKPDGSPWIVRYQALRDDPRSFDPQFTYDQMSRRAIEPVYDMLLEYNPLKTDPYELIPCMLEAIPKAEDDGLTYLCRLKPDIHFHDDPCFPGGKGREVVAEDIQYVFQRICDPAVNSPFESTFEEYIVGVDEVYKAAQEAAKASQPKAFDYDTQRIPGVEVVDRYTFRLHLKKRYPQIVYWLAFQPTSPVAREAVEYYDGKEHDDEKHPGQKITRGDFRKFASVGTGPYRIVEYTPRSMVRLEKVPGYKTVRFPKDVGTSEKSEWLKQFADKPLPFIDEIEMSIQVENIPRYVLSRQGYLDEMSVDKDAFNSMVSPTKTLAPEYAARGMTLERDFEVSTFWITFNMKDPVVGKNLKLRQAIATGYDNLRYSEIFYSGVAPVATQLLPVGIPGFDAKRQSPYAFNPAKAKQLLAEAGYPDGKDAQGRQLVLTLTAQAGGSEQRQRAEFDQRAIESLGIKVNVVGVTFAQLQNIEDKGDYQICTGTGWGADYPDPENYFMLFYSKNVPPAGKNYARFANAEYDQLFEKMAQANNGPERVEMTHKLQDILDRDCPVFFNFNKAFYAAVQPWARRTHNNLLMEGGIKYLYLDAPLRDRLRTEWNRPVLWPLGVLGVLLAGGVFAFIRAVRLAKTKVA